MSTIEQLPALKKRRQERALQQARYGISSDPSILTELQDLDVLISQMELIDIHRANLIHMLRQRTHFGANTPTHIVNSIANERAEIARLRTICAKYHQPVEPHPVDADEPEIEMSPQTPRPFPDDPMWHIREALYDIAILLRHGQADAALTAVLALRREIGG